MKKSTAAVPKPSKAKTKTAASAGTARKAASKRKAAPKIAAKAPKAAAQATSSGWREETLARLRALIVEADPEMIEERKWVKPTKPLGVPVWSHAGIVCTGETYQKVVKLTFMYGASLPDPTQLFNSSLEGGTRRAIDVPEGAKVDSRAFKALIKAAVARNVATKTKR